MHMNLEVFQRNGERYRFAPRTSHTYYMYWPVPVQNIHAYLFCNNRDVIS
jgi:hypothetical protein